MKYTLEEMIAEVAREIALRKNVYPRRVLTQAMTQAQADRHQSLMVAIRDVLVALKAAQNGVARDEHG
jgi:hypothetical protein